VQGEASLDDLEAAPQVGDVWLQASGEKAERSR